jgi:hypothetical protein
MIRRAEIGVVAATLIVVACDGGKVPLGDNGTRAVGTSGASGQQTETGGSPTDGGTGGATAGGASGGTGAGGGAAARILPAPVLDPAGIYGGKTYAQWGTEYWKWLVELPGPDFPILDSTGALCALGQSGGGDGGAGTYDAFFLTTSWDLGCTNSSVCIVTVTRTCTIPAGQMIFIPMWGWFVDNGGLPDGGQLSDDQLHNLDSTFAASVRALTLEIDGESYGSTVSDFSPYLTVWAEFSYTIPDTPGNWYATFYQSTFTGPVPVSFGGGYWILLAPLSAGSHTIHFTTKWVTVAEQPGGSQDVTYNLTVQ